MIGLLHLGYWMMYVFLIFWIDLLITQDKVKLTGSEMGRMLFLSPATIIFFVPAVLNFYAFYTFIFQKFLIKKRILLLIVFAGATCLVVALITGASFSCVIGRHALFNDGYNSFTALIFIFALIGLFHGVVALVMRGFIGWYGDIKIKEELNKKNYETELALMKAQLHPHFLFNTINNIDALIEKDPVKASAYLNKLSDIMRFMLYETKTEKIELSKELTYIDKYIELQKIRTANTNYIHFKLEGNADKLMIEPLLFIPFIENAFKHAENKKIENAIQIVLVIKKDHIEFECQNSYSAKNDANTEQNGLGNELIKKRLQLLYPGKHIFNVRNENGIYKVNLSLTL